ncbi:uncharacterized protein PADG_03744 [Paracoccidioides brasiliensis Pb18]|uniref:Glycan binding protein Y3-like domain-containing protein n=2 Tax=Paracoccidioides brasiliensis TaxID=121759 RepID=C1G908_PARBD|nr:uncharacterized protein PADG_03744 [Paracoccidioides brasiliensis Pb18]EEH47660.1 hypothetical protein PADG_03744 [Paracoccidioides brasiliensis Pb18]ODH44733.1 hypothetical protein ACO22_00723 [Paracoccidioides brasiliensis]
MHLSFILTLIPAVLASAFPMKTNSIAAYPDTTVIAKRNCFDGGARWGAGRPYAINFATRACNEALVGTYRPNDIRAKCYNLDSTKKVDFSLRLISNNGNRNIGAAECYDGLRKEIEGCDRGGRTRYGNWEYTGDPNDGQC